MKTDKSFLYDYGPWALVTDASSGIGAAFAWALAARGLNLVLVAQHRDRSDLLVKELRLRTNVEVEILELDLSDLDFLAKVIAACEGRDIGMIVSNAGFGLKGLHHQLPLDELDRMINVNCRAPMQLAHHFLPSLLERERGGLIITSSVEGFFGMPTSANYSASKAFAKTLGEALYGETLGKGVDTLVLCPGLTDTEAPTLQGYNKAEITGMMSPDAVVREALEALGKQPVLVSAVRKYRIMTAILGWLSAKLRVSMIAKGLEKRGR